MPSMLHPLRAKQISDHKMGLHFEDCRSIPMPITHVSHTGNTINTHTHKKSVTTDNLRLKESKELYNIYSS